MRSFYKHGSNGRVNLFFRPKGLDYIFHGDCRMISLRAMESQWIIQWDGEPEYDSGYSESRFTDYASAIDAFGQMETEENARNGIKS